jgi:DNA-binding transcriptional LysR family regulator
MFDEIAELPETFYLAYPKAKAEIPEVQSLRQWVLDNFQE